MVDNIHFSDTREKLTTTLTKLISEISGTTVTLRELMQKIGEQGLLLVCALASLPFMIPVSIPGVSTVFGAAIVLISLAVMLNRLPWIPKRILDKALDSAKLIPALEKGVSLLTRAEKFIHPRLLGFTASKTINRVNALAITTAGILLMLPLSLIPFSNTFPAIAILLLSGGIIQRDGAAVIGGYLFIAFTVVYFFILAYLALWAGQSFSSLFA